MSMPLLRLLKAVALFMLLPTSASAADLNDLYRVLLRHGFTIEELQPPGSAYGRFIPSERRLEISPLVRELGIARAVFLHEAVHAAQSCPDGRSLVDWCYNAQPNQWWSSRIQYLLRKNYKLTNSCFGAGSLRNPKPTGCRTDHHHSSEQALFSLSHWDNGNESQGEFFGITPLRLGRRCRRRAGGAAPRLSDEVLSLSAEVSFHR